MAVRRERFWLTRDSRETTVAASPEVVYDLVADLPRMGEWSPECVRVEWTGGATGPAVGATFVGHNRTGPRGVIRWSRRGRVLAADRGREFAFVTEEGGRESTEWRFRLEAVDGGTRVTESYDVHWLPVGFRVIDVPLNRFGDLQGAMDRTLARLGAAAESAAASTDGSADVRTERVEEVR
ncbi:SRPBCC family protein [Pseudonocardia sp. KRD-184]|uniref:SRPBCC family protein n=1 Tax=Pseudonocardia oceani TaxID=2792013 RepID=A0ABS6U3E0_9PSEU|nr:SRPBCC family protein [Pseudonocardia oceani]MBW0094222.1 SRPBCC family protein [Pseudonocardia oceani]MBW0099863.1 SRPBCC family protein [Pseudonocardia oceani]MBW0112510.1 SRPBCC family protein [Pseudonocardia oceani]MBW0125453.1 SRPBCC family protein [Pseudonocardia oceani]MBW0126757.1 SRPBCC family protein [Pseudonocardia oceani]